MQLYPSTISTLIAVLSAQNITTTGDELSALLAPLTGATTGVGPNTLQPGETVVVFNHYNSDYESYGTLEAAQKDIEEWLQNESHPLDHVDDFDVSIVRKRLNATYKSVVSFE